MRSSTNYLLVKDDIGRGKPATRDLPQHGFAYGAPNKPDPVGVGGLTSQWRTHKQQPAKTANDVDYARLNRLATKNRVTTARDSYNFRQAARGTVALPDKTSPNTHHNRRQSYQPMQMSEPVNPFGMPNRPSTPIRTVICGTYGNAAEYDQLNRNAQIMHEMKVEKGKTGPRAPTKAMTAAHIAIA